MTDKDYQILFKNSVKKDIKNIGNKILESIFSRIDELKNEPIPNDAIKLKGSNSLYRIRVGDYRIVYDIEFNKIIITIVMLLEVLW